MKVLCSVRPRRICALRSSVIWHCNLKMRCKTNSAGGRHCLILTDAGAEKAECSTHIGWRCINTLDERRESPGQRHGRPEFISYLRVSTDKQGRSGLGLEAQRKAVTDYLDGGAWQLVAEYVEVESGKTNDRPELAKALVHCKLTGATLIVAKLDRLSRDQAFLMSVWTGTEVIA